MLPHKESIFADVMMKLKILTWGDCPGLTGWALNSIMYIVSERGRERNLSSGESVALSVPWFWPHEPAFGLPVPRTL